MIDVEMQGGIAVLRMDHGPVNAMDTEFLDAIAGALTEAEAAAARAVVLTGKDGVFSAGADLKRVLREDESYVHARVAELSAGFMALFRFPRPVVSAINGHAIAGGCVVACAADYRIMARAGTIGLAELRVGVPFPTAALEIVRFATGGTRLQELVYLGKNYAPEDALARNLIDEIVDPDQLMPRALEIAERLAATPERTFRQTKDALRAPAVARIKRESARRDVEAADTWISPEVRGAIKAFLESLTRG